MRYLFTIGFLFSIMLTHAQKSWVGLSIGANNGQIRYKNSDGIRDKNLKSIPTGAASVYLQTELFSKGKRSQYPSALMLSTEIGYKQSKIKDKSSTLLSTWSLQHLTANLALRHRANSKNRVNAFYGGGIAADWLVGGTQTQGFEQFDLKKNLKAFNLSLLGEVGLTYFIGEDVYGSFGVSYVHGISNLEKDPGEQALLHAIQTSISVFFGF